MYVIRKIKKFILCILALKAFQAADDQAAVKEADLEDQVAKYSSVNKENERTIEELVAKVNGLQVCIFCFTSLLLVSLNKPTLTGN